jgi:Fe-S cluster assembly protein SufD
MHSVQPIDDVFGKLYTSRLPGSGADLAHEAPWVCDLRRVAMSLYRSRGLPTTRDENWKYTSLSGLSKLALQSGVLDGSARRKALDTFDFGSWRAPGAACFVFLDGRYCDEVSDQAAMDAGVTVTPLARVLTENDGTLRQRLERIPGDERDVFDSLNLALMQDGCCISLAAGTRARRPIQLIFCYSADVPTSAASFYRNLVDLADGAQLTLIETFVGEGRSATFVNSMTDVSLGPDASLSHLKLGLDRSPAYHVGRLRVQQDRNSHLRSHVVTLGGDLVRNEVESRLNGKGSACQYYGFYFARDNEHVDHHTLVDHVVPECTSTELYKGIVGDAAQAVFNGKIVVRPDAQQTDARQESKTILLSDQASINAKPQLEIFADDVKCTHGATIGQLDQDALFFLRARGLSEEAARSLLLAAFGTDVVEAIDDSNLACWVSRWVQFRSAATTSGLRER